MEREGGEEGTFAVRGHYCGQLGLSIPLSGWAVHILCRASFQGQRKPAFIHQLSALLGQGLLLVAATPWHCLCQAAHAPVARPTR
jgi:hypothetical protein